MIEKKLTPAEKKKREEIAQAIKRDNPKMPMDCLLYTSPRPRD